jgi:hypothetical protein
VRLASPWSSITAILLGVLMLSVVTQVAGMLGILSRFALSAVWILIVAVGATALVLQAKGRTWSLTASPIAPAAIPLAIISIALLVNLLVAIAPSTKIDELYYQMLVASRIVSDEGIHFYRMPWEAAIWPQMAYQISSAPMHGIGYPDAVNVVSWALSATLVWFAWRTILMRTRSVAWSAFWAASLCVGMYPVVWHVTGGAHAMGDLAMAAAIVAFVDRDQLLAESTPSAYAAMVSILLVTAAASKVTLLPVCAVLLSLFALHLLRSVPTQSARSVVLAFTIPWIVFYCPILLWTWIHSGSPFGPMLASIFGSSIFPPTWITQTFLDDRVPNYPLAVSAYHTVLNYSPLVWIGAVGVLWGTNLPWSTRAALGFLFGLQAILIYFLLPHHARFMGGMHYGLVIVFASHASRTLQNMLSSRKKTVFACTILLIPWLGIQLYYAKQFASVLVAFDRNVFYKKYIAFYDDYIELDKILTKDTVLLTEDYRLPSVYAPRPVFFDPLDLPPGKKVVLLSSLQRVRHSASISGYKIGEVIYRNPRAIIKTYRTPGRAPLTGSLQVNRLTRE